MEKIFLIKFGICFLCYIIRTVFNILNYRKYRLVEKKAVLVIIYFVMAILWGSWFSMNFSDPYKIALTGWIRYTGLILFIIGISLFIFSQINMKGFEDRGYLVIKGIYSKLRNPLYLGFILWIIGFPIFMQSLITLVSGLMWTIYLLYWKTLEEKELDRKYEEYGEYKKRTWF